MTVKSSGWSRTLVHERSSPWDWLQRSGHLTRFIVGKMKQYSLATSFHKSLSVDRIGTNFRLLFVSLSSSHEKFLLWTWASMSSPLCRARAVQITILLLQARRSSYAELRSSCWLDPLPYEPSSPFSSTPKSADKSKEITVLDLNI